MALLLVMSLISSVASECEISGGNPDYYVIDQPTSTITCSEDLQVKGCEGATITGCKNVVCDGYYACTASDIIGTYSRSGDGTSSLHCKGRSSCERAQVSRFNSVQCDARNSCRNATITGSGSGSNDLSLVTCAGREACWGSTVTGFMNVVCEGDSSCNNNEMTGTDDGSGSAVSTLYCRSSFLRAPCHNSRFSRFTLVDCDERACSSLNFGPGTTVRCATGPSTLSCRAFGRQRPHGYDCIQCMGEESCSALFNSGGPIAAGNYGPSGQPAPANACFADPTPPIPTHSTESPTVSPTTSPTSASPTGSPTEYPTGTPTKFPPAGTPTDSPTASPTSSPTESEDDEATVAGTANYHFKSWSGKWLDFHGICDLVFLHAADFAHGLGLDIHIRTKARYWYTYIEAIAIQIGDDVLEVGSWGEYFFNGVEDTRFPKPMGGGLFHVTHTHENKKRHQFEIPLGGGESIVVSVVKDIVSIAIHNASKENFAESSGMLGRFEDGALVGRDGAPQDDVIDFGQAWQVLPEEPQIFQSPSLYAGQGCVPPVVDAVAAGRRRLGEQSISTEAAEIACSEYVGDKKDRCVFDVIAMGDLEVSAVHGAY